MSLECDAWEKGEYHQQAMTRDIQQVSLGILLLDLECSPNVCLCQFHQRLYSRRGCRWQPGPLLLIHPHCCCSLSHKYSIRYIYRSQKVYRIILCKVGAGKVLLLLVSAYQQPE